MVRRCARCNRLINKDIRRGLCRVCYRTPGVRDDFPTKARGCWQAGARRWCAYDIVRLRDLFKRGLSDREIGAHLGRSVGSVCKCRHRMGMVVPPDRQGLHRRKGYTLSMPAPVEDD